MKTLMIIYPHWHPVNLAGVHRPRLISNFLKDLGWQPIVLTVEEAYFEEKPDPDFIKTFAEDIELVRVKAYKVTRPRIIGDIGLRAFPFLYKKALEIIRSRNIDFIWIPIPSFYTALLGRLLYRKTKVPYGIDYIDPWVRDISGRRDWRHILSNALARFLEPIAIKKASLITGVAEEYYLPALRRNFKTFHLLEDIKVTNYELRNTNCEISATSHEPRAISYELRTTSYELRAPLHTAFPYGFDPHDHSIVLENITYPWKDIPDCQPWLYAGAFLPNSRYFVDQLFACIAQMRQKNKWNGNIHLYFLGTGAYPGKSIADYAKDYQLEDIVHERRERFPFLQVLNFLSAASGVMVIGSTEKHYTASKVFQSVLSKRPVFAIFHRESSAYELLHKVHAADYCVGWDEGLSEAGFKEALEEKLLAFVTQKATWSPDLALLTQDYSAHNGAQKLVEAMEWVLEARQ